MRTDRAWILAGFLLLLPACGGSSSRPVDPPEPEAESPVELDHEQSTRMEELESALARPEPDCENACALGEVICDLRDRICGIADRHPGDAETHGRCRDASERCDRGRERIAGSCACEP